MPGSIQVRETPLVLYTLRRADDALVLGHRLSEWCGHAPSLEEDMALANIGLDLLGQARSLYGYAAEAEAAGHDEDGFAYLRDAPQYRNLLLLEQPNGDFARTMVRQFFYSAFADPYWRAMMASTDATLAAIAAKSEKESAYHLRHSSEWMIRLGDGTAESHRRTQDAVDLLWPYTGEMFEPEDAALAGVAADPEPLHAEWRRTVAGILSQATLALPTGTWMQHGGAHGAPYGASRPDAGGDAAPPAQPPGRHLVTALDRAREAASAVVDPEIPVLTIADLGVLRDVALDGDAVQVTITPTYSGCPAMNMIAVEIGLALDRAGFRDATVKTVLSPAWTTDWLTEAGRRKLVEYGIAPPVPGSGRRALFGVETVACPRCGSTDTKVLAEFASTSCKALWQCQGCREPFDYFKCH